MSKYLFLVFLHLIYILQLNAQNTSAEAYRSYSQGQYESARDQYEKLISEHGASADLYYNLGLCHLNLGQMVKAKLNFERALLLKPGFKSIKQPLAQINHAIEPKIEALPPFFLYKGFKTLRDIWNKVVWGWILLVFSTILGLSNVLKYIIKRKIPNSLQACVMTCFILSGLFYFSRAKLELARNGILMERQPLRIAPEDHAQELLPLGAGTKMEMIDSLQGWYKVQLENNDQGWVMKTLIQKI